MDTYDRICTIDALYRAYRRARRGKRRKMARFEYQEQLGLSLIRQELIDETYTPGPLKLFYVYEPKKRDVLAPTVKDKIVLHALCDEYLYDTVTRSFIAANTASRPGKAPRRHGSCCTGNCITTGANTAPPATCSAATCANSSPPFRMAK